MPKKTTSKRIQNPTAQEQQASADHDFCGAVKSLFESEHLKACAAAVRRGELVLGYRRGGGLRLIHP